MVQLIKYLLKFELTEATNISLKWITEFARDRAGKSMSIKLANEIMDAAKEAGNSIRRKNKHTKWLKQIKLLLILDINYSI